LVYVLKLYYNARCKQKIHKLKLTQFTPTLHFIH